MNLLHAILLYYTIVTTSVVFGNKEISFRDPNIQYIGRWHNTTRDIQSGWPGAYFKVTLQQTRYIKLQLSQPTSLVVIINNEEFQFTNISTTTPLDLVPHGLVDDGPHELVVIATNVEPLQVSICLSHIILDDTASTVPPETIKPVVEYVGHDLTLGIESSRTLFTSFAWLTSKLLGLEHAQVAYRNAKLVNGIDEKYFDRTMNSIERPWSVVILLGSNDDDQSDYSSNEYRDRLNHFLIRIRKSLYETAPIFILSEPLGDMFRPSQESVIDMTHAGDQHVYFIDTTSWLRYGYNYYKDPKHLNDAGHELLAKKLAPLLQIKLTHPRDPLPGPSPNPNLPGEWQTIDVGQESRIGLPGTVSADSATTFTLWGSGADIDNESDAFRFVYQGFSSQGILEATVRSHSAFAKCAKAGIMMREHLGHGSPLIMLGISPAEGIFVQVRYGNFQSTKLIKKMRASPPYRLRLIRQKQDDLFEAQIQHVDSNMEAWETLAVIPFVLARDIYAGLAVTSCDTSVVSVAKFTEVGLYHSAFTMETPRFIDQQQ